MNKWQEFDYIKTPEHWKNISFEKQTTTSSYRLSFIITIIVFCISLTTVVAYHHELEEWIQSTFHQENVHKIDENMKLERQNMGLAEPFIYQFETINDEEIIQQVYLVSNHELQQIQSSTIEGYCQNKSFSFEYVLYKDHIFGYNMKGNVYNVLPRVIKNHIYFMSADNDLMEIDIMTKQVKAITNDHISVNPIMSPNGKTILINKSDQYWTVYDIDEKIEKKVNDIDGCALSNEVYYIDDYTVSTYHSDEKMVTDEEGTYAQEITQMYIIDLKTLQKKVYDETTEFATPYIIDTSQQEIEIKNILTNQKYTIQTDVQDIGYYKTRGYFLFFGSDENNRMMGYLYSIENNQHFTLKMPKGIGEIIDISIIDETKDLLVSDDQYIYLIDISYLFDE